MVTPAPHLSEYDQQWLAAWAALRAPFPASAIGKKPQPLSKDGKKGKCNECGGYHVLPAIHLDYVGHAAVTARLLEVDPHWTWEPLGIKDGLPVMDEYGGIWIRLTVLSVTRLGYGAPDRAGDGPNGLKSAISDAIRNAAMRFGVALDLWSKEDLSELRAEAAEYRTINASESVREVPAPVVAGLTPVPERAEPSPIDLQLKSAAGVLADHIGKDMARKIWESIPDKSQRLAAIAAATTDAMHIVDIAGQKGEEIVQHLVQQHAKDPHAFLAALGKASLGEVTRG